MRHIKYFNDNFNKLNIDNIKNAVMYADERNLKRYLDEYRSNMTPNDFENLMVDLRAIKIEPSYSKDLFAHDTELRQHLEERRNNIIHILNQY